MFMKIVFLPVAVTAKIGTFGASFLIFVSSKYFGRKSLPQELIQCAKLYLWIETLLHISQVILIRNTIPSSTAINVNLSLSLPTKYDPAPLICSGLA